MIKIIKHSLLFYTSIIFKVLGTISLRPFISSSTLLVMNATWWAPLIGFFSRPTTCITFYVFRTIVAVYVNASLGGCILHLPTLAGSLILSSQSKLLKAALPLGCILIFVSHPIGNEAWLYTLYWLIPLILSCISTQSIFLRSLASTFTTHAVGSTIWLYTHPTTHLFWHALIAQVWLERLAYAVILTVSYYCVTYSIDQLIYSRYESRPCQNLLYSS